MFNFSKKIANFNPNQLQWLFTLAAILLAWRVIYIQHGWINDDSVLYFEMARLFALGEWKQALAIYNWPLYSALLALLHKLTGLGIHRAAELLNIIFFAITTYSFITLIRQAGGTSRTISYGALLLFSTQYIVGDVLPMLLRDQGFWAFSLTSFVYFVRFYRDKALKDALLWQLCAIVAVLFRIEAISFLFFLPLILLLQPTPNRAKAWVYANALSLLGFILITFFLLLRPQSSLADFGRLNDLVTVFKNVYLNLTQVITQKATLMGEHVLGSTLNEYELTGIIVSLIAIVFIKCITAPGWLATLILATHWRKLSTLIAPDVYKIAYWIIAIAIFNAAIILVSTFVLSGRYVAILGLIMLVLAAFCLDFFARNAKQSLIKKVLLMLVFIVLALSFVKNILPKRAGHNFEQDAVAFIKTIQKPNTQVFYVSPRARYYAGQRYSGRGYDYTDYTTRAITDGSIERYDYLAINMNSDAEKQQMLEKKLVNHQLIKVFLGPKAKKKVLVFVRKE